MPNIYVLSAEGSPLMPIHSYGRARRLISSGKARIARRVPFTIQLTYNIENVKLDTCIITLFPYTKTGATQLITMPVCVRTATRRCIPTRQQQRN